MAWHPSPEVAVARDASRKLGNADQVIIIHVNRDKGQVGMASYGKTKDLCNQAGKLGNVLFEAAMQWLEESEDSL